ISDRIAFQYGTMTPEAAVSDFIAYLDNVRQQLLDAGEDPSEHLLTVALDGENWMFMSEFQHHDNARPFMAEWYGRLADHPTIVTTTPSEFLTKGTDLPEIQTIGTGSWIDGTLRTWAGEEEESLAWQRLVEARQALVEFEASNPNDPGLPAAWESLYIAEGSDWYWWYGLDQDSGYDENWDVLFKVHLSNIYRAINLDLPPYLQDLWTNPAVPDPAASGIIEPMIDGIALPGEWDGAARYDAPVSGGNFDIESFHFGYDASNVFIRVDAATLDELEGAAGIGQYDSPDLAIYFMQPNAVNFNEAETNFRTYYGNQSLGFPSKHMVAFDFDTLREDGRAKWNLFSAQGKVGDEERWVLTGSSNLGGCAVDEVYEFSVPWADIGLAPRYSTRVKVVTSWRDSLSYGDGTDAEMAPPAPAEMVLPDLEQWVTLLELDDAVGDETGDGDYVYPLATDFNTPGGGGLWDATHLTVRQSAWNAQFILTMNEMTDIWGLANGFSHQIVQIYVDQGDTSYGRTSMLTGANAEVHPDWAWEVAISGTGEPGAVQAVQAETGSASARGVDVSGDVDAKTITFTVSKDVIGSDIPNYRYIIVIGSQDGFGTGKWRDVMEEPATWTLGGGANPAPDDGIDYDPNIIDVILEGEGQTAMLSSYDVAGHTYAQLTGFEMPEVPQQIFGASVDTVTSSSAVLTWSTTVAEATSIKVAPAGQTPSAEDIMQSTPAGTDHAVTVTGLEVGTSYWAHISANDTEDVIVWFNTSSIVDETAPELLNLAAEVLEDGRVTVSWYTSESATESILINGESVHEDAFATKKNHAFTTEVLGDGTYDLEVISADASGNINASSLSFTVDAGATVEDTPNTSDDGTSDDEAAAEVSNTTLQLVALIVLVLVLLAFLRVRGHEPDEHDPWK
ncbi:MAG: glucodextranase DOMON-like domain-containing protein, partial [Candidatus Thermoplasmatota archaeon]|nr:glucodextranase DOMON-like domain-containing protein [Candidatus Thermoplasmatota archaeon]